MPLPKRNHGWIWYFIILVVLTVLATTVLIVYNLGQQLQPEQLEAARQQWKENRPADYSLAFTIRRNEESNVDKYSIKVQNHAVVEGYLNGLDFEKKHHYSMDRLFQYIEEFQEKDQKKGTNVFRRAQFDPDTGAILKYVRRVMGSRERVEITVTELRTGK